MTRRLGVATALAVLLLALFPTTALAHGIGGRLDLPVPLSYFLVAAGLVLVVSFVALAVMWPTPRLQDGPHERVVAGRIRGTWVLSLLGLIGLVLVVGQLFPPLFGLERDASRPTIAPVLVWVDFWLVIPFVGALVGNWYRHINPWRTIARGLRLGRSERLWLFDRVGLWPAAILFVAFAWMELISGSSGSPVALGVAALGYTLAQVGYVAYAGVETGLGTADLFTPYNRMISSISPLGRGSGGELVWRGWLRALPALPSWKGFPVFVVAAIGTVTFDGASNTQLVKDIAGGMTESKWGKTLLLLGFIAVIGLAYWLASASAARLVGGAWDASRVASRFAHSLVPIALAYALAHYLTLVLFEGQQLIAAISDPFGLGWDLFGTAGWKVDFFIATPEPVWYAQVAIIVVGHLMGVVLAHDRALADFGREAVRSQYAMLLLMVSLTILGLSVLAA